ncbi:NUDIX hydrolase [Kitasatospora fiedleri]|uniref:NUDIX hydrolase n=1 Tax=Kitasatospora fiedleri TaxID=2991545 RepID=UPI00249C11C4|nr:NUDIX hydrolase [Kitasatospora fiedleri]
MTTPQPLMPPAAFAATLPHHIASAGVLLADDRGRILMLRQARGYPGHPAWWQLPAGLADPGEAPPATARRELAEETGLQPGGPLRPLAVDYPTAADGWPPVIDFTFATDPLPAGCPDRLSHEHDAYAWRTVEQWLPHLQPLQQGWFRSTVAARRAGTVAILRDGRPMT